MRSTQPQPQPNTDMPNLPDQTILAEAADGERYSARVKASVTNDGTFSVSIPDDLMPMVRKLIGNGMVLKETGSVELHRKGGVVRLHAKCMAYPISFLKRCALEHITVEVIRERVIVYRTKVDVSFWLTGDGVIEARGSSRADGRWWEATHGKSLMSGSSWDTADAYAVGVGARVMDRLTYKRATGDTVKWEYVRDSKDEVIEELNSFTKLRLDPEISDGLKTMPYSPKAAMFFIKMMKAVCAMAKGMDDFFADDARLMAAIENPKLALPLK